MLGGIQAVIWNDVIQFCIMFGGLARDGRDRVVERAGRLRRDLVGRGGGRQARSRGRRSSIPAATGAGRAGRRASSSSR